MFVRVVTCLVCLLTVGGTAYAQKMPPPGTPIPEITYEINLNRKLTRLRTQVQPGDVVVLKKGGSRAKSNWAAVIRFEVRPSRESATGFATIIRDRTGRYRGLQLNSNVVFITKSQLSRLTNYLAEASRKNRPNRRAKYMIDEEQAE